MADAKFIFQGIRKYNDHDTALNKLLRFESPEKILISVAFVRKQGVECLAESLSDLRELAEIYVGIRNGVTSVQGILELLKTGIKVFIVDTGSYSTIFHPKIYIAYNSQKAQVIVGSANMTFPGLNLNIEGSTLFSLDRNIESDEKYITDLIDSISTLPEKFPEHVFRIKSKRDATRLLREGRLDDERIVHNPSTIRKTSKREYEKLNKIKLYIKKKIQPPAIICRAKKPNWSAADWIPLWESNGLTERDLNIPRGTRTHATGSMLFKKGRIENIDQRHYFRNVIFKALDWSADPDPKKRHLERAETDFEMIIKGINYGIYKLKLTHNTRTDTRSYEQLNAMTQIHWGEAKALIAQDDLLGRILKLYKKNQKEALFLIEID